MHMQTPTSLRTSTTSTRAREDAAARANLVSRSRERSRSRSSVKPEPAVTIGGSLPRNVQGDLHNAVSPDTSVNGGLTDLKEKEHELSFLNSCLKNIGKCIKPEGVARFLKNARNMLPQRALECELLVPMLSARFEDEVEDVYESGITNQHYIDAREGGQWKKSWEAFVSGCLGLSKASKEVTRKMLLGNGFHQGWIEGAFVMSETVEQAVLRWGKELRNGELVLGASFMKKFMPISDDMFKERIREDVKAWFTLNRREIWENELMTLFDLALEAKEYEGTEAHGKKGNQLLTKAKAGAVETVGVNAFKASGASQSSGSGGRKDDKCWLCAESGHRIQSCGLLATLREMAKKNTEAGTDIRELRQDVAAIACSASVDRNLLTDRSQREMA